jgi:hypothetical protein
LDRPGDTAGLEIYRDAVIFLWFGKRRGIGPDDIDIIY